jgi:hypothetical protein
MISIEAYLMVGMVFTAIATLTVRPDQVEHATTASILVALGLFMLAWPVFLTIYLLGVLAKAMRS